MVLLFVVCGWREEAVAGVCQRTYSVHSTYVCFCTRATISLFQVKPTVEFWDTFLFFESIDILIPTLNGGFLWLSSSLGNGTVAGSYRYDSWQLQFWDTFLFFESIDILIPTFKPRIFMNSWQLYITKLAATVSTSRRILYQSMIPT
jgi:hypothetical protein